MFGLYIVLSVLSMLYIADLSIRRSPKLFERPPQDVEAAAAQDGTIQPQPVAAISASAAQQPEIGLKEDEESKEALSTLDSEQPVSDQDPDDTSASGRTAKVSADEASAQAESSSTQTEAADSDSEQSEAAELRRQMEQLRQAMTDKAAALEAAQAQTSSPDESPSASEQAQPQPKAQPESQIQSMSPVSEATARSSGSVSTSTADQQPPPPTATGKQSLPTANAQQPPPREPLRVLPRPQPTSESATIFIESSPAPETIRTHPVLPDQGTRPGERRITLPTH